MQKINEAKINAIVSAEGKVYPKDKDASRIEVVRTKVSYNAAEDKASIDLWNVKNKNAIGMEDLKLDDLLSIYSALWNFFGEESPEGFIVEEELPDNG